MSLIITENLAASKVIGDLTRSTEYTEHGRQFSRAFAAAMGVNLELFGEQAESAGLRLALINHIFENAPDKAYADNIFQQLENSLKFPASEEVLKTNPHDEIDAINTRLAFLTVTGYKRLASRNNGLAIAWLSKWSKCVEGLCEQEKKKTYFRLGDSPQTYYPSTDIVGGVDLFLRDFSKTGAVEVAVIGNFPFVENPSKELLELSSKAADIMSPIFRFAQDVTINPSEKVNMGLFAYSLANDISLDEARLALTDKGKRNVIQGVLADLWEIFREEQNQKLENLAQEYPGYVSYMDKVIAMIVGISDKLVTNWQKIA